MNKEAVYYRKTDIKKFEDFKDGDCICEVCNGWGYFYDCEDNKVSRCYHCLGKGKLDWITNATGAGMSGTNGLNSSSAHIVGGSSGHAKLYIPTLPPSSPKSIPGGKSLKQKSKVNIRQLPKIKTIPYKEKISWRQKIMNVVADK